MQDNIVARGEDVPGQRSTEILESISDAFYAVDRDWRFTYVNRKAEQWWGRPRETLIGKVDWDEFPQAVGSEPYKAHLRAAETREVARLEAMSPILGHWVDISIYPTSDGGLSVYFRDISEKKGAEDRLRTSETRYRTLFEAIDSGFCVVEMLFEGERPVDYRFLEANPAFAGQTGLRDVVGRTARELVPDLEDHWFEVYGAVAATGIPARFENGSVAMDRWFDVHALRVGTPEERRVAILFNDISERRRSELALAESEARFRLMADAVPQIIWITDAEGRVEFFNKQWSDYTGVPYEPTTAADVAANHVHPDDGAATMAAFAEAQASGTAFCVEHRIRSAASDYRWFLVRAEPYRAPETGEIVRWFGASIDIHDRRLAEEQLRELNATLEERVAQRTAERNMLATIVETTDVMVMACDLDFNILALNAANADEFERIYAKRPKAGDNLLELLSDWPEHQDQVRAGWERGMSGEQVSFVEDYGDPDRGRPFYEITFRPLWNEAGDQIGAYQFVTDVTERLRREAQLARAEAARREADALYRAYFENSPEALFVVRLTPEGGFVVEEVNAAHEAGVGFKMEEVRGQRIEDILPPDVAEQVLATYRQVAATGSIVQYREVFDLSGDPRYWDTSIVPVKDADGAVVRLIGSSRDMTRQVTAEEALRQSQKMEALGQLTGGVAHDFNNLLTPIVGALDILQRKGVGGERERRLIAGAAQSAERAKTLVQRLLAFARRQPLQPVPVDVDRLVRSMADLLSSTAGPQIRVVVDVAGDLPPATADANQLEMALLNLGVNARDAMPEGGTLRVSATRETVRPDNGIALQPGTYVKLSVADTGTGMDEATLARAVEPFFSTKGIGRGTGLGLSMAHGLARQLGGTLTIQSQPGLGTNVELWLPESHAQPELDTPAGSPSDAGARGTVLLVDDEEVVRMSTADMLLDCGYEVVEAPSAEAALQLVQGGVRFDVLITDHLMPGMTGVDLAREIQSSRPGTPVLIVSGYAEKDGLPADLPRLAKPFLTDELIGSLASVVAQR